MTLIGYKWLHNDMSSVNGNETPWEIGEWKKWNGKLELCLSGFHACENPVHSLNYNYGNRFFIIEARGNIIRGNDKFVVSEMRILQELPAKEIMVRFAIACAKHCLFRYEAKFSDSRPRRAIEAAEQYLVAVRGTYAASAAGYAASAASAAGYVAYSAAVADVVYSAATRGAADVVYSAATRGAADVAYSAATRGAAHADAERKWQNQKLQRIIDVVGGL